MTDEISSTLQQNLSAVNQCVQRACERSGRSSDHVNVVAVTKYADWEWVQRLSTLHSAFGENRPQQLAERQPLLPDAEWHLIGQLQRNKVRLALKHASLIHSVDSLKLLRRIADIAKEEDLIPSVLLQINVSGEASKSGFTVDEIHSHWSAICGMANGVTIKGLMTMAPASDSPEVPRSVFRGLHQLRDELANSTESQTAGVDLRELSMGMSGDFQVAIEEGATLVRIGRRLFDGLSSI